MQGIELAKQLAWIVTTKKVSEFGAIRASVKNFYSGSRAISDPALVNFVKTLPHISTMIYNYSVINDFEKQFTSWIQLHSSNCITGLEQFEPDISQGATQAFDSFYIKHSNRTCKFLTGEYFYHILVSMNLNKSWKYINSYTELSENDALILSMPFCDTGSKVNNIEEILNHCTKLGIPVLLDCAYFTIASNINLNLLHSCIDTVVFSLSKTFPVAHARIGMRYTKKDFRDGQKLHSQINYDNRISAGIGLELIKNFPPDYIVKKYQNDYNQLVKLLKLLPGDSIMFAEGDSAWQEYGRKSLLDTYKLDLDYRQFKNRICLTQLLEHKDTVDQALEKLLCN